MWILFYLLVAVVTSHPHGKERDEDTVERKFLAVRNKIAIEESGGSDHLLTPREKNLLTTSKSAMPVEYSYQRWPHNQVPIEFHNDYSDEEKNTIRQALGELENWSCFTFPLRDNQEDYIFIEKSGGCGSYTGRIGGRQSLFLGQNCVNREIVHHEMMHALGFAHEHQRGDRDDHITVEYHNIKPENVHDYDKENYFAYGRPYTYHSIMHYGSRTFALDGPDPPPTMVARVHGVELGPNHMIEEDILRLRSRGHCEGADPDWPKTSEDITGVQNRAILSDDCIDTKSTCRKYALDGYCGHKESAELMAKLCPNSCKPQCLPK